MYLNKYCNIFVYSYSENACIFIHILHRAYAHYIMPTHITSCLHTLHHAYAHYIMPTHITSCLRALYFIISKRPRLKSFLIEADLLFPGYAIVAAADVPITGFRRTMDVAIPLFTSHDMFSDYTTGFHVQRLTLSEHVS